MLTHRRSILILLSPLLLSACDSRPWNNPYPQRQAQANILYTSFSASPKTLDPARSYSNDEAIFLAQIYEPPLQYHYLKRPYTLTLLTTEHMPTVTYQGKDGKTLADTAPASEVAYTLYDIFIRPGIYYQPHPAFAKNASGRYEYFFLPAKVLKKIHHFEDLTHLGSRELTADDYVYQIKRLAEPNVNSPIFGLMAPHIQGLADYARTLKKNWPKKGQWLDLRQYPLSGARAVDRYHYQIRIQGKYPQFIYWLAMPFFAPIPWEADALYAQAGMAEKNITFNWHPVGTGAYMLVENDPNRRMVLKKNPLFHPEFYPQEGEPTDKAAGYLKDAGKRLPFIDAVVFTLEKETIPRWNKFLQGYYDRSTVSSDSFDQAIQMNAKGQPYLTPELRQKGISLQTTATQTISYMGFNMLDEVVGGESTRARKLRLAISIAVNFEEYINIFLNGRGRPAQGPLPPGTYGYVGGKAGINPFVYDWVNHTLTRKPIEAAKHLMQEAGYPDGINPRTRAPLILNYDLATSSGPDEKALLAWLRQQFAKIGIQLNIRNTEYNRFQQKMRLGESQIFSWGWISDYPDPENFLFLLYGPNGKAKYDGENASNYANKEFDQLFDQMKTMPNNAQRLQIINQMLTIIRRDAPWMWGIYPQEMTLSHSWNYPAKINVMTFNVLKYQRINPILRYQLRNKWNQRTVWPLAVLGVFLILLSLPVCIRYWQKERKSIKKSISRPHS